MPFRIRDKYYICKKFNNLKVTMVNNKKTYRYFPNYLLLPCIEQPINIGVIVTLCVNIDRYQASFKNNIPFLNPQEGTPPTNPKNYMNISPVKGYAFPVFRSVRNLKCLKQCSGFNKYFCKYTVKGYNKKYLVVSVGGYTFKPLKSYISS